MEYLPGCVWHSGYTMGWMVVIELFKEKSFMCSVWINDDLNPSWLVFFKNFFMYESFDWTNNKKWKLIPTRTSRIVVDILIATFFVHHFLDKLYDITNSKRSILAAVSNQLENWQLMKNKNTCILHKSVPFMYTWNLYAKKSRNEPIHMT